MGKLTTRTDRGDRGLPARSDVGLLAAPAIAQDKQLRIFNWSDYVDPEVLDAFKKETGITRRLRDTFDQMETVETKLLAGKTRLRPHRRHRLLPAAPYPTRPLPAGR